MNTSRNPWRLLLLAPALLSLACNPDEGPGPQSDSHTNWLRTCGADVECDGLQCVCGMCTTPCDAGDSCTSTPGAACLPASDAGVVAACAGSAPPITGMCLPRCDEQGCGPLAECVAGSCQPTRAPSTEIELDATSRLQSLTGFGATVGYSEAELATLADRTALDRAMFTELGLDVLRFRNRYAEVNDALLGQATTLVSAATEQLGRRPLVLLTAWSPPASLKQNGGTFCLGGPDNCTLTLLDSGEFDYPGLAAYWRDSLAAYAQAGLSPDYIGIQNNPDWVPPPGVTAEACKFLPKEGDEGGTRYPGYEQALTAVVDALEELDAKPRILAPELSGIYRNEVYLSELDMSRVDAIAHHMYGLDGEHVDTSSLSALGELREQMGRPLFQTEMQAGGFDTALLMHHALVTEGAAMYLQTALVGPRSGPSTNPTALIGLEDGEFVLQDPYFAMSHYARFTDPGWRRVRTNSGDAKALASAWLSPDGSSLSVVLINAGTRERVIALGGATLGPARVTRTVFDGSERMADLGRLKAGSPITLPPRSMATARFDVDFGE